jgi:uncharacterized protein (DUF885 family)
MTQDASFDLAHRFVDEFAKLSPIQATLTGIPGRHAGWDDFTPEGAQATLDGFRRTRSELEALPPLAAGDRWGKVSRRGMHDFLSDRITYWESDDHLSDLNNIESPAQHIRTVFDLMDHSSLHAYDAIIERLTTIETAFDGYSGALKRGRERGRTASVRQVRSVIEQTRATGGDHSSLDDLLVVFDTLIEPPSRARERLTHAVAHAKREHLRFAEWLETGYLPQASERDALGREIYERSAMRFLGMRLDLEATYAWGFEEIRKLEQRMENVAAKIAPGSPRAVIEALKNAPEEVVRDPKQFLAMMHERQLGALSDLEGKHFDVPREIRKVEVRLAPPGGALGAYYIPPNEDMTRPGAIFYSVGDAPKFTLFTEITTAYHEGFPGHHLQCGLQVYFREHLSRLHRLLVVCSGYAEGWALYAEELMDELGYFEKPSYVLGMLMAKLFRACRVVVDIGMHLELPIPRDFDFAPGETWNFELGKRFMAERAFLEEPFAASETTRYLGWPGQAISYKVGEKAIFALRDLAKERGGANFDQRKFHEAVLSSGSVGLDHLSDIVKDELAIG